MNLSKLELPKKQQDVQAPNLKTPSKIPNGTSRPCSRANSPEHSAVSLTDNNMRKHCYFQMGFTYTNR